MPTAPKNNLHALMSCKSSQSHILPPITASTPVSSKKFKPAPIAPSRSTNLVALPSFATSGFRRRAIPSPRDSTISGFEIVEVSSDSSPGRSVKRTSSDPSVASDRSPQTVKRLKQDNEAEKENQTKTEISRRGTRITNTPLHTSQIREYARDDSTGEKPWFRMELDHKRTTLTKLDRDFPDSLTKIQKSSFEKQAPINKNTKWQGECSDKQEPISRTLDENPDLLSMSTEILKTLLFSNFRLSKYIMDLELSHHRGITKDLDIALVQRLVPVIDERIDAIQGLIASRESSRSIPTVHSPSSRPEKEYPTSARSTNPQVQDSFHAPKQYTANIDVTEKDDTMSGSEVEYWAGVDDVSLDIDDSFPDNSSHTKSSSLASHTANNDLTSTSFYLEIEDKLRVVFGLKDFRPNQLKAITETLLGRDVFILMPTGGGKSLCYQLPAVCQSGKTRGVTVVVSPLLALMKDQVYSLKEKGIDAFLWAGETPFNDAVTSLRSHSKPKLLYITPEKLKENNMANKLLGELYHTQCLARFVIDEAHCISTWGQDFREAYQHLGALRDRFPDVPIMALTATATKNTVADITERLKLRDHVSLKQSFNRPNLKYVIKQKNKKWMESMMDFIRTKHPQKSGVIYCLSRDKCEEVARKLNEKGFRAMHFHAGMETSVKEQTLADWRTNEVHIIVATIAFGMGIDKADVRFVIHYSLPKSLDGYYQETGRAGRDGQAADCILYFLYKDFMAIKSMIERPDSNNNYPSKETIQRQTAAAQAVVDYCNGTECRRVELLHYFDENFDKVLCNRGCDNCENPVPVDTEDVTEQAKNAVALIKILQERAELVTLAQSRDILRGATTGLMRARHFHELEMFGSARELSVEPIDILLRKLCMMGVLVEHSIQQASGFHTEYVKLGSNGHSFLGSNERIVISWRPKSGKGGTKTFKQTTKQTSKLANKAKGKQKIVDNDPIELFDEDSSYALSDNDAAMVQETASTYKKDLYHGSRGHEGAEVIELQADATDCLPQFEPRHLLKSMRDLRKQLMVKDRISDVDAVFSDQTLEYLSATCPQDYKTFLANITDDFASEQEATQRYDRYGASFLNLCIQYKIAHKAAHQRELTIDDLRSRYEFPSVPGPASRTRIFKFKPHS